MRQNLYAACEDKSRLIERNRLTASSRKRMFFLLLIAVYQSQNILKQKCHKKQY